MVLTQRKQFLIFQLTSVIPVPLLCRCSFIVKQSFHNTGDMIHVHKCHSWWSILYFIFRRSWVPLFTQRAVTFTEALCGFPQPFMQTLRCYFKCTLILSKSFPIHHAQSPSHSVSYNVSHCFAKETLNFWNVRILYEEIRE